MKPSNKPNVLLILDGWGHAPDGPHNAISAAKTPNFDSWWQTFSHTTLTASGAAVGLLEGDIGNSEVGHLTMGSGRTIPQPVLIIHHAIEDGTFFENPKLIRCLAQLKQSGKKLHLMGLLSDASVHSHSKHLEAFLQAAKSQNIKNVFIHPFLDGRDVPPQSAKHYLDTLETLIKKIGVGKIGSLHGRFYAMDRDNNWKRTEQSYKTLTEPQTTQTNWKTVLEKNYSTQTTDEFIPPTQLDADGIVQQGDGIIFFNFRPDRARQLTKAFLEPTFNQFQTKQISLSCFITPVVYSAEIKTTTLFGKPKIKNSLPDVLSANQKTFFAIAETEKYAHVTYFFSGGREEKKENETRVLIPSIPAKKYVDKPEMSAAQITDAVLESLQNNPHDFYLINYANADMVGHSGNMDATVKAVEFLDQQLKKIYEQVVEKMDGTLYITADHGNAEKMFDQTSGQPRTAHTTNPVPFIMIQKQQQENTETLTLTELSDIAPFILKTMGIKVPPEMKR